MKHFLTLMLTVFIMTNSHAQPAVPLNEQTGEVEYIDVVQVSGADVAELYKRIDHWYNEYFVNPSSVIQERNPESYFINGRHNVSVHVDREGTKSRFGQVRYNINIAARDGRIRYEISDIILVQRPRLPIHEWLDPDDPSRERNFDLLNQVHEHMLSMIENMTETVSNPLPGDAADDW